MNLDIYRNLFRDREENYINLQPIQRGGVLTPEAKKALIKFADGYSVCDYCLKGRLDMITTPPIQQFTKDLAEFLGMDEARVVPGARQAKRVIIDSLPGETIIVDPLAHYTTYVAAEAAGKKVTEVPHSGPPTFQVDLDAYAQKIEETKDPAAVLLTHVDYLYGNLNDPEPVAKAAKKAGVPFILNCAYTAGIMPIDGKGIGADFIVGSGHKSFASAAPTGVVATTEEYAGEVFRLSQVVGDWSGRKFPIKEVELLGCTVMGVPLITMMASFPHVVERVKHFDEEVKKTRYLIDALKKIKGTAVKGQDPHNHTLFHVETPAFYEVSKNHKRRGWFLYDELKKKKITGVQPGLTKHFKLNTYGATWEQVKYAADVFLDIGEKYGILEE